MVLEVTCLRWKVNGGSLGTRSAFLSVKSGASGLNQELAWLLWHRKADGDPVLSGSLLCPLNSGGKLTCSPFCVILTVDLQ